MIPVVTPRFRELSERLGGFDEHALRSIVSFNDPLHLKHWTMNVIELLLIGGAVWGFLHARRLWRRDRQPVDLCVWWAAVLFMLTVEVPIYFPQVLGGDPSHLLFLHNEFTVGFLWDRAPLYIMALYPALMYSAYALVARAGLFERRFGTLLGAVAVGFVHHVFYEVFDHFGPQYGWWIWDYRFFASTLASVPVMSMFSFAFMGPLVLTLLSRLLVARYVAARGKAGLSPVAGALAWRAVVAGVLTPVGLALLMPTTYYQMLVGPPTALSEPWLTMPIVAAAGAATVVLFRRPSDGPRDGLAFPAAFLSLYLAVFAVLWACALPDYAAAVDGVTARGTPIGSLPYAAAAFAIGGFLIWRTTGTARRAMRRAPGGA